MNYKSVWLIKIHIFVSIVDVSVACLVSMIKTSERRAEALLFGSQFKGAVHNIREVTEGAVTKGGEKSDGQLLLRVGFPLECG